MHYTSMWTYATTMLPMSHVVQLKGGQAVQVHRCYDSNVAADIGVRSYAKRLPALHRYYQHKPFGVVATAACLQCGCVHLHVTHTSPVLHTDHK